MNLKAKLDKLEKSLLTKSTKTFKDWLYDGKSIRDLHIVDSDGNLTPLVDEYLSEKISALDSLLDSFVDAGKRIRKLNYPHVIVDWGDDNPEAQAEIYRNDLAEEVRLEIVKLLGQRKIKELDITHSIHGTIIIDWGDDVADDDEEA